MGLSKPSPALAAGMLCLGVALLLQIVGLATTAWLVQGPVSVGLFEVCVNNVCADYPTTASYVEACRAFGILAVLALAAGGAAAVASLAMDVALVHGLPIAGAAAGALCGLIECAVFAGKTLENSPSVTLGYSFFLTIVAGVLAAISAGLFINNMQNRGRNQGLPS